MYRRKVLTARNEYDSLATSARGNRARFFFKDIKVQVNLK
jgi:hypothetical protein